MLAKLLKLCSAAVLGAALLSSQDPAGSGKAVFEGFVQDSFSRLPPYRATVRLTPLSGSQSGYLAYTDPFGTFRFEAIEPGDYSILVKARGFMDGDSVALLRGRSTRLLSFA